MVSSIFDWVGRRIPGPVPPFRVKQTGADSFPAIVGKIARDDFADPQRAEMQLSQFGRINLNFVMAFADFWFRPDELLSQLLDFVNS